MAGTTTWLVPLCLCGALAQALQSMDWGNPTEVMEGLRAHPESFEAAVEACKGLSELCAESAQCPRDEIISGGGVVLIVKAMGYGLQAGEPGKEVQLACADAIAKMAHDNAAAQKAMLEQGVIEALVQAAFLYGDSPDFQGVVDAIAEFKNEPDMKDQSARAWAAAARVSQDGQPTSHHTSASQPMVRDSPTQQVGELWELVLLRSQPDAVEVAIEACTGLSKLCDESDQCPRKDFIAEGGDLLVIAAMGKFQLKGEQGEKVQRVCAELIGKVAKGDAAVQTAMAKHEVPEALMSAVLIYGDSPATAEALLDALAQFTDASVEKAEEVYVDCVRREAASAVAPVALKLIETNLRKPSAVLAGLRYASHLCHYPKVNAEIVQSGFLASYDAVLEAYPEGEVPLEVVSLMSDCFDFGVTGLALKDNSLVGAAANLMATYNTPEMKSSANAVRAVEKAVKTFRMLAAKMGNAGRADLLNRNVKEELLKGMRDTHTIPCDDFTNPVFADACLTLATLDENGMLPPECMTQY